MANAAMTAIYEIVMDEYNKVSLKGTQFYESWEFSVKQRRFGSPNVIVRYSKTALKRMLANGEKVINLEECKIDGDMGVYKAELIQYDSERNQGTMRLLSNDPEINDTIVKGTPLCSEKFFRNFWRKKLRKFGDMNDVLMR